MPIAKQPPMNMSRPTTPATAPRRQASIEHYRAAQQELNDAHAAGEHLVGKEFDDTNYIFLSFVTRYLPAGVVGLIVAVIFSAAMSSASGEINSLATVTVIDIYRRHVRPEASDRHYLIASRFATVFWGCFAMGFAQYGRNFGALIQAVNVIGSLFYGGCWACSCWRSFSAASARTARSSACWRAKQPFSPPTCSPRFHSCGTT
jgi:Na+(H+)/acetate symporter ActP